MEFFYIIGQNKRKHVGGLKMGKIFLICIVISMSMLTGCQSEEGFYNKIEGINQLVDQADWKQTKESVKSLKKMYKDKRWTLQLLGDEAEYEGINVELEKLEESANAKDKTQVKVSLGTIRGRLYDIYSF